MLSSMQPETGGVFLCPCWYVVSTKNIFFSGWLLAYGKEEEGKWEG